MLLFGQPICWRCMSRGSLLARQPWRVARRFVGQKYLAKKADAAEEWERQAARIRAGKQKSMLSILEERGYIQEITG